MQDSQKALGKGGLIRICWKHQSIEACMSFGERIHFFIIFYCFDDEMASLAPVRLQIPAYQHEYLKP